MLAAESVTVPAVLLTNGTPAPARIAETEPLFIWNEVRLVSVERAGAGDAAAAIERDGGDVAVLVVAEVEDGGGSVDRRRRREFGPRASVLKRKSPAA